MHHVIVFQLLVAMFSHYRRSLIHGSFPRHFAIRTSRVQVNRRQDAFAVPRLLVHGTTRRRPDVQATSLAYVEVEFQ